MSDLASLQADFLRCISAVDDSSLSHSQVLGDDRLSATERLEIYRHAYCARLLGVLQEDYPCVRTLMGDGSFTELANRYRTTHPSTFRSLRWYGEKLPAMLASETPWTGIAGLAEVAEWERVLRQIFDSADAGSLVDMSYMQVFAPEDWASLRFTLVPALEILTLNHNTVGVWKAVKDQQTPPALALINPESWLIWRSDLVSHFRSLSADEAAALHAALAGETFAGLCECLWEWHEGEAPLHAAQFLQRWFTDRLVTAVENSV